MTKSKFVIVKHEAQRARLHYDLRFVMPKSKIWASFAVRKGVPTQAGQKVLAVRTHDHTEKEALFFGTIKKGYGAGKLTKWDDGTCTIHKYTPGHIVIEFSGRKVKGLYHMVSTGVINKKEFKKKSYMLFKATKQLNEREWDEPDSFKHYLSKDRFIKQNRDLSYSDEYNDETHAQQPTLAGLLVKRGGDYLGRDKTANMYRDPHTGVKILRKKENLLRNSFLKPGDKSKLKPGEEYERTTLKKERQEKEFPKKSQFPKLMERYLRYLDEAMGMISLVPRGGITDDVENSQDELESPDLHWDPKPKKVVGPASSLGKLKSSKFNME
jgi:DNA ligase D-like protein (predicted 3'-phosphoesterase)